MKFITLDTELLEIRQNAALIMQIVIPRPIALISTLTANGVLNLAPFSYFQVVSVNPLAVGFSATRDRHGGAKQTHVNIRGIAEFVAAMVTEDMAERMNITSAEFPPGVSEFEKAGFTAGNAEVVKPSLIMEAPVNMECKVIEIVELSDSPMGGTFVIGKVVRVHFKEGVYDQEAQKIRSENYKLISRLGGSGYGYVRDQFDMPRPMLDSDGDVIQG